MAVVTGAKAIAAVATCSEATLPAADQGDADALRLAAALVRAVRDDVSVERAAVELAARLIGTGGRSAGSRSGETENLIANWRIAQAAEFMSRHFAEPVALAELADVAGMSKHHFVREFRAHTGMSPYNYLIEIRLRVAGQLLALTSLPVTAVAAACGYKAASHFSTVFTRKYGVHPTGFRAGGL